MDTSRLLMEFSAKTGVAGCENEAVKYGSKRLSSFGAVTLTPLGSVICQVRAPQKGGAHIMLDAHIDEIGLVVTYIGEKGFLRVSACGGVDRRALPASSITVHAKNGPVKGVICSIPPHLAKDGDERKHKRADELDIDIGASSRAQAEQWVSPGDRVTLDCVARKLLNGRISGRALDDRAGCAVILKALEYLDGQPLSCGLTAVFSTMEEIGGQGAKTAAYTVNPTHAVAVDVSFAHTPDSKKEQCGELSKGPMIGFAPILSRELSNSLRKTAEENGIPYQSEVMGGKTGTNADHIAVSRNGVATALLSVPLRYMHTPVEIADVSDVENTGKLLAAFVRGFNGLGGATL